MGRAVVAGRNNPIILNNDGTNPIPKAIGTTADCHRDRHKIIMNVGTIIRTGGALRSAGWFLSAHSDGVR
jgi:hypothetical protein